MGITGLLPFLKKSSRPTNLSEFKGKVIAIDTYCWIHRGAFSCADKLALGEPTDRYVLYVMKLVNLLLSFNIKPILVLDGCHLPAKSHTESKRRENRSKNRAKAKELLRNGNVKEARECFQRCVDVTSEMAFEVIKACRAKNIDIIVAPYEADAQLAYLNLCGIADCIITEDSDLVLFGCDKILFKMDSNGGGCLIEKEKLHLSMNVPRDKFCFEKFRNMCILSGCDYLPSLKGIGLSKACRFFTVTSNTDVYNALCKLPSHLKMYNLEVTQEYREGFVRAVNTLLYQLVFDPVSRTLRPLTPYPDGLDYTNLPYCGAFLGHDRALQIALGNINVQTGEQVDSYNPNVSKIATKAPSTSWFKNGSDCHRSIWSLEFNENLQKSDVPLSPIIGSKTLGKSVEVKIKLKSSKKRKEIDDDESLYEKALQSMYFNSSRKRSKTVELNCMENTFNSSEESNPTAVEVHDIDTENVSTTLDISASAEDVNISSNNATEEAITPEKSPNNEIKKRINPFAKSSPKVEVNERKLFKFRNTPYNESIKSHVIVQSRYFASPVSKSPALKPSPSPQLTISKLLSKTPLRSSSSFQWKNSRVSDEFLPPTSASIFDTPPSSQDKENLLSHRKLSIETLDTKPPSPKNEKPTIMNGKEEPSVIASSPIVLKSPKCRVSGLRKTPATKQKQLTLKEMFSFKKH